MNINIIVLAVLAVLFEFTAWWRWRGHSRGTGRLALRLILFAIAFVLGEIYFFVWIADLKWPHIVAFAAIAAWGTLLLSRSASRAPRKDADAQKKN